MRERMKKAGSWQGKAPSHLVPELDEGEPPAKKTPETIETPGGGNPEPDPEEGTSAKARGKRITNYLFLSLEALWQVLEHHPDSHSWYGAIAIPGASKAWIISNAMMRRRNYSLIRLPYFAGDGGWRVPLWKIAGIPSPFLSVPVLLLVQRPLLGL